METKHRWNWGRIKTEPGIEADIETSVEPRQSEERIVRLSDEKEESGNAGPGDIG